MIKGGLGKGLDALFNDTAPSIVKPTAKEKTDAVTELEIFEVEPNPDQPRKYFDETQLEVLAESIKKHGVIQPIIVTEKNEGFYTIIAGERRWRAARLAGLTKIPAVIRSYDEQQQMEVALVENLQREDLNPIEEAKGYRALMDAFNLTQEQISEKVGKSRSAIANTLRLLALSPTLEKLVLDGDLSEGHARALLSVPEESQRLKLAELVIKENLSVRELERLASRKETKPRQAKKTDENIQVVAESLAGRLGTKVKITHGAKKGKIEIEYYGTDDLNRILSVIER